MWKREGLADIHCIPDCYTACASPFRAAHSRFSFSRCSSMAFFFFASSSVLPRFPSAHRRTPSLSRTVCCPRGMLLHPACRKRSRRMHGHGSLGRDVSGCAGWRGLPSKMGRFCMPSWRQRAPNPNALNPRMEVRRDMVWWAEGRGRRRGAR